MEIVFSPDALDDLDYWKSINNEKVLKRIREILENTKMDPFHGIGKPEPLKHNFSGMWSRRINKEHRVIYEVTTNTIIVHSLKEHY